MLETLTSEELQFLKAIEKFKSANDKMFLSWSEVLTIVHDLGYRKVAKPSETPRKKRRQGKKRLRTPKTDVASS